MAAIAESIVQPAQIMLWMGQKLCEDIPDDKFAYQAIENLAHPAFIMGHITLYAEHILDFAGKSDLAQHDEQWQKLFGAGVECVNDPEHYPDKSSILKRFSERYAVALEAVARISDDTLLSANDTGRMEDRFTTKAALLDFILNSHPMMHLGQISAWRRVIGLGSVL
jgi:hypothetical protein